VSETTGSDEIGATQEGGETGKLEERERRQHAVQQHGDTFAVDSDQPTDTSGVERDSGSNRVTALPGDEPEDENA
jgi:hypothetical protein